MHLLVTAHIGGNLHSMPRLFTVMKQIRQSLDTRPFLIDTGLAWSPDSWVCVATENRAPYIVMDAMTYALAFADGLDAQRRQQLQSQMFLRMVMDAGELAFEGKTLHLRRDFAIQTPVFDEEILKLPLPPEGVIQHLVVNPVQHRIEQVATIEVPPSTLPDPTIAATVEFVVSEARYYRKKQEGNP